MLSCPTSPQKRWGGVFPRIECPLHSLAPVKARTPQVHTTSAAPSLSQSQKAYGVAFCSSKTDAQVTTIGVETFQLHFLENTNYTNARLMPPPCNFTCCQSKINRLKLIGYFWRVFESCFVCPKRSRPTALLTVRFGNELLIDSLKLWVFTTFCLPLKCCECRITSYRVLM
eukprot:6489220-Amphidinium_carterae.1